MIKKHFYYYYHKFLKLWLTNTIIPQNQYIIIKKVTYTHREWNCVKCDDQCVGDDSSFNIKRFFNSIQFVSGLDTIRPIWTITIAMPYLDIFKYRQTYR